MKKTTIYIPARYNSSRFPGKLLKRINGEPLISIISKKVKKLGFLPVLVSGDKKIINYAKKKKIKFLKSKQKHISGMSRVSEVIKKDKSKIIYILFGDELYLSEEHIKRFINNVYKKKGYSCWHLLTNIKKNDKKDQNVVKCLINHKKEIVDFSRKFKKNYNYKCVGLFAFKKETLANYSNLEKSNKELKMKVEQFKLLENNIKINSLIIDKIKNSINSKKDLEE